MSQLILSKYAQQLEVSARNRYCAKIERLNVDPFCLGRGDVTDDLFQLPAFDFTDVVFYLVYSTSYLTAKELKCKKSLGSYVTFLNGWVKNVCCKKIDETFVILGKVRHSQRASETPLRPWFILSSEGAIETAHCTCMAGLGEVCSHVASILFYVEAYCRIRGEKSCTQDICQWNCMPIPVEKIKYLKISEIDFTGPTTSHKNFERSLAASSVNDEASCYTPTNLDFIKPTETQQKDFFKELSEIENCNPAILSIVPKYCDDYVPIGSQCEHLFLKEYFRPACMGYGKEALFDACKKIQPLVVTDSLVNSIELLTRNQYRCKLWFRLREGRITASKFKQVLSTNENQPSLSLIKSICYPQINVFSNPATEYGIEFEATAARVYEDLMKKEHKNFLLNSCGFILSKDFPFIGATPDGTTTCDCCGKGVIEIKCPYSLRLNEQTFEDKAMDDRSFPLELSENKLQLKISHAYYYQVQCQLFVSNAMHADFIMWTPQQLFIERIRKDVTFMPEKLTKANSFFQKCILPELMGKLYTRQ